MRSKRRAIASMIVSFVIMAIFFIGLSVIIKVAENKMMNQIENDRTETLNNFTEILNSTIKLSNENVLAIENKSYNSDDLIDTINKKVNEVETFDFFEEDILNVTIYNINKQILFSTDENFKSDLEQILNSSSGLYTNYFASNKIIVDEGKDIGYLVVYASRYNYDIWTHRLNIITRILLILCVLFLVYAFMKNIFKINKLQYRDSSTGLLSKGRYKKVIQKIIEKQPNLKGQLFVIGFRDLYDFETPNTELLDEVVIEFSTLLKKYRNSKSVAFRVSERKLGLYVHDIKSTDHVLERLLTDVEQLLRSKRFYQNIQYYMGISEYPLHEKDVDALVNGAIYALETLRKGKKQYHIKNYQMYDPSRRKEYVDRQYLYDEVEKIINERRVYPVFQAIVDIKTGKIMGYEALSRPISELVPNIGMLISLASEMNISEDLELLLLYMINKTVTEVKETFTNKNLFINTNVSVKYGDKELVKFKNTIDKITDNLVVEITEYNEIDFETITDKINKIKEFGAEIAIDDFGSGYSNELALLSLKPDIVKIDMALIRNIDSDQRKYQIVSNLINYAKNNDIKTLAEGVETSGELKAVKELGVEYVQGFIFSKPDRVLLDKEFDVDAYIKA